MSSPSGHVLATNSTFTSPRAQSLAPAMEQFPHTVNTVVKSRPSLSRTLNTKYKEYKFTSPKEFLRRDIGISISRRFPYHRFGHVTSLGAERRTSIQHSPCARHGFPIPLLGLASFFHKGQLILAVRSRCVLRSVANIDPLEATEPLLPRAGMQSRFLEPRVTTSSPALFLCVFLFRDGLFSKYWIPGAASPAGRSAHTHTRARAHSHPCFLTIRNTG